MRQDGVLGFALTIGIGGVLILSPSVFAAEHGGKEQAGTTTKEHGGTAAPQAKEHGGLPAAPAAQAGKYAIILQAGKESHEGMARAVHAFLYAKELKEHGHEVVLIFDGAGTEWAEELSNPESQSKLKPMYEQLKQAGVTEIICDFCAGAFAVKEQLVQRQLPLTAEYAGHPSIAKWADQAYALMVL